jgi:aminopeptidase N
VENDATARTSVERAPEIVDFESSLSGPYPFEAMGGTVVRDFGGIENQARPTYRDQGFTVARRYLIVHEMAHQWFGNSVPVENWSDICLAEGFATYAEWLWSESTVERRNCRRSGFRQVP